MPDRVAVPVAAKFASGAHAGRSTLVTTNKPLAALGEVLHDADLAEAILDRLLERGTHYVLRGRSYRNHREEPVQIDEPDAA